MVSILIPVTTQPMLTMAVDKRMVMRQLSLQRMQNSVFAALPSDLKIAYVIALLHASHDEAQVSRPKTTCGHLR